MLEPNNRKLLLESLQPPLGFKLDLAIGTTYTLDLIALLSAPVAFAFSDAQDRDGNPLLEPLALLKATREYASRMLLFCQAGKINVPKNYQSLLSHMEESIAEAVAPKKGGRFHPKVHFLRFIRDEESPDDQVDPEEVRYRFLCLSRNLTFDRSWDTSLRLDGVLKNRKNAIANNHPLGEFLEALPGMCPRGVSREWAKRITNIAYEIRRVEFELPLGFDEVGFLPIGISDRDDWIGGGDRIDRMLIVSPFVSESLLSELSQRSESLQIVSKEDQLSRLSKELLDGFDAIWTMDDAARPELMEVDASDNATDAESEDASQNSPKLGSLSGLHAKLFVIEQGWNARVVTGSANATNAAFTCNVEFMTQFVGKKKFCGINAILGMEAQEKSNRQVSCFGDLLVPFTLATDGEVIEDSDRAFELAVEDFAKQIAPFALSARCVPIEENQEYRLILRPTKRSKAIHSHFLITARPLSLPKERWFDVDVTAKEWLHCEPVSLLGLTSFFVFRVVEPGTGKARQFVVNAPLENSPSHRHEAILNAILSDSDRVQRFLMLLLGDAATTRGLLFDMLVSDENIAGQGLDSNRGNPSPSLFETLMKTLATSPDRIRQAAKVVADLRKSEAGAAKLPEGFASIWDPIYAAWGDKHDQPKRIRKS
jgi:hypothetical protein